MKIVPPYNLQNKILNQNDLILQDHLNGFDIELNNPVLNEINQLAPGATVTYHQILSDEIQQKYANLQILFSAKYQKSLNLRHFIRYNVHPAINYKNFVCSFNGTAHVGRKLLAAILYKFGYFSPEYCSKNMKFSAATLDGHLTDFVSNTNFYSKFFIDNSIEEFFQEIYSFGHVRFGHAKNIHNLEYKLTESFLHIVSETMPTSYYPFVTEKFLYSIVTRGLFLAYAQPGWHEHIEKYYGFKRYTKLFDYQFDCIQNPVERLVELMCMISKFSKLSTHDWHDLYQLEADTIEYNYDWYFSNNYFKQLKQFSV